MASTSGFLIPPESEIASSPTEGAGDIILDLGAGAEIEQKLLDTTHKLALRAQACLPFCLGLGASSSMTIKALTTAMKELQVSTRKLFQISLSSHLSSDKRRIRYMKLKSNLSLLTKIVQNVVVKCSKGGGGLEASISRLEAKGGELANIRGLIEATTQENSNDRGAASSTAAHLEEGSRKRRASYKKLYNIVAFIRNIEKSFFFQQALFVDKLRIKDVLNCTVDQLTYGSTYFQTFKQLFNSPAIQEKFKSSPSSAPTITICGSSQGLLSFYCSALVPNSKIYSYEVLPLLHNIALVTAERYKVSNTVFLNQDMHEGTSFKHSSLIILTSLCWDKRTRRSIARKIIAECPVGTVVVDYQDDSFSIVGCDFRSAWRRMGATGADNGNGDDDVGDGGDGNYQSSNNNGAVLFRLVDAIEGMVSWGENQKLFVYSSGGLGERE